MIPAEAALPKARSEQNFEVQDPLHKHVTRTTPMPTAHRQLTVVFVWHRGLAHVKLSRRKINKRFGLCCGMFNMSRNKFKASKYMYDAHTVSSNDDQTVQRVRSMYLTMASLNSLQIDCRPAVYITVLAKEIISPSVMILSVETNTWPCCASPRFSCLMVFSRCASQGLDCALFTLATSASFLV